MNTYYIADTFCTPADIKADKYTVVFSGHQ